MNIKIRPIQFMTDRAMAPQLYDYLRKSIVDNSFAPGAKLSESTLADQLGVSRTPLRAALQQLANEGLILTRPQSGTTVAQLDPAKLKEAVFIRCSLESSVVEALARSDVDLAPIDEILAEQERLANADDYAAFFVADEKFHNRLAELANVPRAWQLVQSVKGHVDRQMFQLMAGIPMRSQRAFEEHQRIVESIRAGDEKGAKTAMIQHVSSVLEIKAPQKNQDEANEDNQLDINNGG